MMPSFTDLANEMLAHAQILDNYLFSAGRLPTSFNEDTLDDLPPDIEQIRNSLIDAAQTTKRLALGPRGIYSEIMFAFSDEIALRAIYKYNLASCVPLVSTATFTEISKKSGLREDLVERFLRQAMGNHIFTESPPGHVLHTAASRLLVKDSDAFDAVGLMTCELSPVGIRALDALEAYPDSEEQSETAWALQNEIGTSPFAFLAKHPERARRFGAGMRYFGRGQGWDLNHLVRGYPWEEIDRPGAVFVDVGGGHGTVSQALARVTRNIQFVVQDLPGTVKDGRNALPAELRGRISFTEHDFFTEQPVYGADVYFFRWILHNWSDKYCRNILKSLIPALKKGSRIMIYEFVLKDGPETRWTQKQPRNLDLLMLAQFNAPERTAKSWEVLLHSADPKFTLRQIKQPVGSLMSVIEAVWEDGN